MLKMNMLLRNSLIGFFVFTCFSSFYVKADEGMWLLNLVGQLNMNKMKSMGCTLSAEDIYTVNNSSLKDAIGSLDHGSCTAELISPNGLLLTNHHCGYDEIQSHSSVEHDYLTDGFWASNYEEELPNPGKTISFLVKIVDVTEIINNRLDTSMSENERDVRIKELSDSLVNKHIAGTHYEAEVNSFFGGNDFYLSVYETFMDVRFVGAPPSSIGKFGGDTDNWMWPRHTGDFSLFRVYAGPDGKPAEYSEDNVPYKSKHFLPISLDGYKKDDFAMVFGFPGSTDRYLTSWGVKQTMDIVNDTRVIVRSKKLEILKKYMDSKEEIKIQYASKYYQSSNYWKYSIGQNEGLEALNVVDKKEAIEDRLRSWIIESEERKGKYDVCLPLIENSYQQIEPYKMVYNYWTEAIWFGPDLPRFMNTARMLKRALEEGDEASVNEVVNIFREKSIKFYKDYNPDVEQELLAAMLKVFYNNVDPNYHPAILKTIEKKYKGDFSKYTKKLFKKSFFVDKQEFNEFLNDPSLKDLEKDMGFELVVSLIDLYGEIFSQMMPIQQNLDKGRRLFIAALRKMDKDKTFYPDANSTLRMTYGTVGDYEPADAVIYKHYTTLKGVMEKEDPQSDEFKVPKELKSLYRNNDYGKYGVNGEMRVCFTTNNDITGGNSGSPVINGKGELIGLAFDGNWEAMSGDIAFEPELQKCINVDIRYVLFIIDKFAGATNLINEMKILN
jgi:hypothetical protein